MSGSLRLYIFPGFTMPSIKKARCTPDDAEQPASKGKCVANTMFKRKWKSFPSIVASNASLKRAAGRVVPFDGVATLITDSSTHVAPASAEVNRGNSVVIREGVDVGAATASAMIAASLPSAPPSPSQRGNSDVIREGVDAGAATASAMIAAHALPSAPPSPSQREAFQASLYVTKVTSNLSTVNAAPGARVNFDGTVIVVYPCEANPVRRYVLLADEHGTIGITFWNQNVSKFSSSVVGHVIQLTKVLITQHNGKKSITMNKESGLTVTEQIAPFWTQLARNPITSILDVHSMPVNSFVTIAGVLGFLHSERKIVKDQEKELVIMKLIDRTGQIEVQSWVSKLADFSAYRDRPVKFQRLRVVAFAGIKCLEILDGNGTLVHSEFEGCGDLAKFWNEPV